MKNAHRKTSSLGIKEVADKVEKVSFNWAKLIARIYEVNPLLCTCGREIKIVAFVTHTSEIRRILSSISWSTQIPEFDPPYDLGCMEICQLIPNTEDGFLEELVEFQGEGGPDPPFIDCSSDPPFWEDRLTSSITKN